MEIIDVWDDPNYVFEYDPTSKSCLRWKNHKRHPSLIGTECGTKTVRGEWAVQFRGMPRLVHRIVWEMFNGKPSDIDIIRSCNGDLGDPRIENLYIEVGLSKNPQSDALKGRRWKEVFEYRDGNLYWLEDRWSGNNLAVKNASKGDPVYTVPDKDGYSRVKLGLARQAMFLLHRLIYEWHFGEIPSGMVIDHIDRDINNNYIENLRCVTTRTNARNKKLGSRNRTGILGVSNKGTLWVAHWREDDRAHYESFSILKYGEEEAKRLAIECRNANIARLNELYGEESYTDHHGL